MSDKLRETAAGLFEPLLANILRDHLEDRGTYGFFCQCVPMMRIALNSSVLVLVVMLVAGCDAGMTGTYRAEVEQVRPPPAQVDPGYSLEDVRSKLDDDPRLIVLKSGSRFETREGDRIVWEGTWRREDNQLLLRAERVNGIEVTDALQYEKKYPIRDGAIIDEGNYGAYGLHLVYRRK